MVQVREEQEGGRDTGVTTAVQRHMVMVTTQRRLIALAPLTLNAAGNSKLMGIL